MRMNVALSTKLDYDELLNVTRVAKDGTYGTVSSGNLASFRLLVALLISFFSAMWRGQPVAVKLLRVQSLPDAKVIAAFEKEMLLLSKLRVFGALVLFWFFYIFSFVK